MADRRMISRSIIRQEGFLDLPLAAQALYMHLMAEADDDGFVASAKRIARMLGTRNNDLKVLVDEGYVMLFPSGVAHVTHWLLHNSIKKDRYKPTIYTEEKKTVMEHNRNQNGTETESERNQTGTELEPQNSIDKNRIEKKREDEIKIDNLRKEEDSNAITNCDIDNIGEGYMDSFEEVVPPPEEEAPPDYSEALGLPEPLVGEGQAAPTLGEIKAFIAKNGFYLVDAEAFYKYYNKHGWEKAVNWKEKVLHWHFNNNPKWRRQS